MLSHDYFSENHVKLASISPFPEVVHAQSDDVEAVLMHHHSTAKSDFRTAAARQIVCSCFSQLFLYPRSIRNYTDRLCCWSLVGLCTSDGRCVVLVPSKVISSINPEVSSKFFTSSDWIDVLSPYSEAIAASGRATACAFLDGTSLEQNITYFLLSTESKLYIFSFQIQLDNSTGKYSILSSLLLDVPWVRSNTLHATSTVLFMQGNENETAALALFAGTADGAVLYTQYSPSSNSMSFPIEIISPSYSPVLSLTSTVENGVSICAVARGSSISIFYPHLGNSQFQQPLPAPRAPPLDLRNMHVYHHQRNPYGDVYTVVDASHSIISSIQFLHPPPRIPPPSTLSMCTPVLSILATSLDGTVQAWSPKEGYHGAPSHWILHGGRTRKGNNKPVEIRGCVRWGNSYTSSLILCSTALAPWQNYHATHTEPVAVCTTMSLLPIPDPAILVGEGWKDMHSLLSQEESQMVTKLKPPRSLQTHIITTLLSILLPSLGIHCDNSPSILPSFRILADLSLRLERSDIRAAALHDITTPGTNESLDPVPALVPKLIVPSNAPPSMVWEEVLVRPSARAQYYNIFNPKVLLSRIPYSRLAPPLPIPKASDIPPLFANLQSLLPLTCVGWCANSMRDLSPIVRLFQDLCLLSKEEQEETALSKEKIDQAANQAESIQPQFLLTGIRDALPIVSLAGRRLPLLGAQPVPPRWLWYSISLLPVLNLYLLWQRVQQLFGGLEGGSRVQNQCIVNEFFTQNSLDNHTLSLWCSWAIRFCKKILNEQNESLRDNSTDTALDLHRFFAPNRDVLLRCKENAQQMLSSNAKEVDIDAISPCAYCGHPTQIHVDESIVILPFEAVENPHFWTLEETSLLPPPLPFIARALETVNSCAHKCPGEWAWRIVS